LLGDARNCNLTRQFLACVENRVAQLHQHEGTSGEVHYFVSGVDEDSKAHAEFLSLLSKRPDVEPNPNLMMINPALDNEYLFANVCDCAINGGENEREQAPDNHPADRERTKKCKWIN
jgi:hypothetical protein